MPNFICVDGEGRDIKGTGTYIQKPVYDENYNVVGSETVETGCEHLYTFLASSTGDCIREWNRGLTTSECFDFLLSQKKVGNILVGFSFGYDDNMMFRDMPTEALADLWKNGFTHYFNNNYLYKISYLPNKWLTISRRKTYQKRSQSVRIWDVFGFFQHKFVTSLEEWLKDEDPEILQMIREMKDKRGSFTEETAEETEHYCLEECRLLHNLMIRLQEALEKAEIHLKSWHGAGAISSYLFTQHNIGQHVRWDDIPEKARSASLWAYFGGRIELFQQGPFDPPIYDYDLVSAYPSTIIDLPSLRSAEWYGCEGGEINILNPFCQYGLFKVSWDTRSHAQAWLAPFPQRGKDGRIYWLPEGTGWYHTVEVQQALKIFGSRIKVEQGVYCVPKDWEEKPFSWMGELVAARVYYKSIGDSRHIVQKLGFNSGYGKLAQGGLVDGKRPKFQNYYLAGLITATTRAKMLGAASNFYLNSVLCIATDGLFTLDYSDTLVCTNKLGGWELTERKKPFFLAQAGVFFTPDGKEVRTRGFNPRSIDYARCMTEWNKDSDFVSWSIPYFERRFVGLAYAASTGRWFEHRRWVDRERELTLRLEPRKIHSELTDGRYLLYPGYMECETVPYTPKEENAVESMRHEEMQELFERLEQPDFE